MSKPSEWLTVPVASLNPNCPEYESTPDEIFEQFDNASVVLIEYLTRDLEIYIPAYGTEKIKWLLSDESSADEIGVFVVLATNQDELHEARCIIGVRLDFDGLTWKQDDTSIFFMPPGMYEWD